MLLSDVSIRRPVFATMLNLVLVVFGLFALPRLAIDQFPDVDFPTITVQVVYPGADPESVEQRILEPLEEAVNGIAGLDKLMATAYPNIGQLVLMFKLEKNGEQALQETRDKIFAAVGKLPDEAETPIVQKFDIGGAPVISVALSGNTVEYGELSRLAKDVVSAAIERVNGVAAVNTAGIREREVQVFVERDRLASFGLTASDIVASVQQQNLDMPAGRIENDERYWALRVKGRLANGEQIGRLPIISQAASAANLRVSDVATIKDSIAEEKTAAFLGKTPTILLSVQKQAGSNTPAIADGVQQELAKLRPNLPKGVSLDVVSDNSIYIKGSIDSVKLDLVLGAVLATFIVLVFLRDFWITVISAIALPTSVIATFAFMQAMGFTLNMMSTLGLSLAIGILIDDAIIVIENIHRHLGMGKTGAKAAKDATSEIGLAVVATTGTICAVFVPVAFMEGIVGRFFFQFGLTVAFSVAVSLFVAFTLTPMLSARLLKGGEGHEHKPKSPLLRRVWEVIEGGLTALDDSYRSTLRWCLSHRLVTLLFGLATFVLSIFMLRYVPMAFFPREDRAQLVVSYTLPEGTTLDVSKAKAGEVIDSLAAYPGVEKVVTAIAATREAKPNKLRFDVLLVDKVKRSYTQAELLDRLRTDLGSRFGKDGAEFIVSEQADGGGGRTEPIQYILSSNDWPALVAYSDKVAEFVRGNVKDAVDVSTSKPKTQREFRVQVDPARAADLAVSTAQIGGTLRALYEGDKISEIEDRGTTFDVRLRIDDKDRVSAEALAGVALTSRRGQQITLGSIATIVEADAPAAVERFNGQRQIVVFANFKGKDLNAAANQIDAYLKESIPPGISVNTSGQTEIMKNSMIAMLRALGTAILLVYMILCAQYERYLAPLIIMAALPLSLTGAFGSLLLTGQVMSIYAMIGIILLMGLVTKNGILLIDFTLQRVNDGLSVDEALMEAGPIRLRPILMTTFAAGGGMLPVAIGHGVGGEARSPLGVAVIGGLLMSTFLTLVVVPCLFSWAEQMRGRVRNPFKRRALKKVGASAGF
jgi:HAE1 family hydrophobic/amphiphilic exporter-1